MVSRRNRAAGNRNSAPQKFGYSYDREDYTGAFDTPEAALAAAMKSLETFSNPPTTIYVGRLVHADPQAADHAEMILNAMKQRALVDYGDSARAYLRGVTAEQTKELDGVIETAVLGWLGQNKLMPTFARVEGIIEHPVPLPKGTGNMGGKNGREVVISEGR
jgi:hypothetical protein